MVCHRGKSNRVGCFLFFFLWLMVCFFGFFFCRSHLMCGIIQIIHSPYLFGSGCGVCP